jgi:tetratricopeptide (TPR) repeat protein
MENIFKKIIDGLLYSLVFLLPLFFLPATVLPVVISKQVLLSLFVFLLFILWMVKVMTEGKLTLASGKLPSAVLFLLLVLAVSTVFSGVPSQSFWGMAFEPDTLFSFILYGLVFFLFANLVGQNQVKLVLASFLASSGILATLFLVQIFWKPIFPWDFARSPGFNPVGSVQALAVFLGGAFVILFSLVTAGKNVEPNAGGTSKSAFTILKRLTSVLPLVLGITLFIAVLLINQRVSWLGISLAATAILGVMAKNLGTDFSQPVFRKLILPLFILAFSLTLVIVKVPTDQLLTLPVEIGPTGKASLDIAIKTLKESPKNLILGSGPATFSYQYGLHRGIGPNLTDFWQIRFDQGASAALTFLTNAGVLGILAIFLIVAAFLYQTLKAIYKNQAGRGDESVSAVFAGGFYYLIAWFLYPSNLSLAFALFLMLGLWTALVAQKREFSFSQSPQKAFSIMLSGTILVVVSAIGIYSVSQKYLAALNYTQGISLVNVSESKLDEGIKMIDKAAQLDPKDIYLRNLSKAFLIKIDILLNDKETPSEQKQKVFQTSISDAELSANSAVSLNSRDSQNWAQLANVYGNLASVGVQEAGNLAISNFQKAIELEPKNPQFPLNLAETYKLMAERNKLQISLLQVAEKVDKETIKRQEEVYQSNLELAKQYLQKSIDLKNDFQPALDFEKEIEKLK